MNPNLTIFLILAGITGLTLLCCRFMAMQRDDEDRRLMADNADITSDELHPGQTCPDCLMFREPGVCWCGFLVASKESHEGHVPQPWGCKCGHGNGGSK